MIMNKAKLLIVLLFVFVGITYAQRTTIYTEQDKDYKTAINLYEK